MPVAVPNDKPRLAFSRLAELVSQLGFQYQQYPLFLVGIRGYYLDMAADASNNRGIYDDALFVVSHNATASFNANTDPSVVRKKTSARKGMARLKPGVYMAHKFDVHRGRSSQYPAICQRLGAVTVIRDGNPDYEETGTGFGINIHKGGFNTTSSEGCQTIYPPQWDSFYALAKDMAVRAYGANWNKRVIPYILIENKGQIHPQ